MIQIITDAYSDKDGEGHGHADGAELSQQPQGILSVIGHLHPLYRCSDKGSIDLRPIGLLSLPPPKVNGFFLIWPTF
jgi:metallophosphoesterase superfamily enzyme